jgi:hypothetical protein
LLRITAGPFRDSARGLVEYIDVETDRARELKSLAGRLSVRRPGAAIASAFAGAAFALVSERFQGALAQPGLPAPFDWIEALESRKPGYAIARWRQSGSTLWLTAALMWAEAGDSGNGELIEAASALPEDSPAFDTVTFKSIRLTMAEGRRNEARNRLDAVLGSKRRRLSSVENAYREQRMALAVSFDDLLRWAARRPIGITEEDYDIGGFDEALQLGYDGADALNHYTPLSKLMRAAVSTRLPAGSRGPIAVSAWTRAFILRDDERANSLASAVARTHPGWAADLGAFAAASGDEKSFLGALVIERHSDFHPDVWLAFAPEWWCVQVIPDVSQKGPSHEALTEADRSAATGELRLIAEAGAAQSFLAPIIVAWARAHPEDVRVPEALHRLVRMTRFGCRGVAGNGGISRAAFDLLHTRYAGSEWTRRTPYWFDQ